MGEKGTRVQFAWECMYRYSRRHPWNTTLRELLRKAILDPATDIYTKDDQIAEDLLVEAGATWKDPDYAAQFKRLWPYIREHGIPV